MARKRAIIFAAVFLTFLLSSWGCADDAASQRRIRLRRAHLQQTVADLTAREAASPRRLEDFFRDQRKWQRIQAARFQARWAAAGDRFW